MIPGVPVVRELGTAGPSGSTSPMVRSPSVSRAHAHHGTGMPGDKRITSPKGARMMRMSSGTDPRGTIKHVMNQKKDHYSRKVKIKRFLIEGHSSQSEERQLSQEANQNSICNPVKLSISKERETAINQVASGHLLSWHLVG